MEDGKQVYLSFKSKNLIENTLTRILITQTWYLTSIYPISKPKVFGNLNGSSVENSYLPPAYSRSRRKREHTSPRKNLLDTVQDSIPIFVPILGLTRYYFRFERARRSTVHVTVMRTSVYVKVILWAFHPLSLFIPSRKTQSTTTMGYVNAA